LEGDFGPVFKNTEKRPCIAAARFFQWPLVARLKPESGRPRPLQIGTRGVWAGCHRDLEPLDQEVKRQN
jgi:hypothetical protein